MGCEVYKHEDIDSIVHLDGSKDTLCVVQAKSNCDDMARLISLSNATFRILAGWPRIQYFVFFTMPVWIFYSHHGKTKIGLE